MLKTIEGESENYIGNGNIAGRGLPILRGGIKRENIGLEVLKYVTNLVHQMMMMMDAFELAWQ